MQEDLDTYMNVYNYERAHQGERKDAAHCLRRGRPNCLTGGGNRSL